MTETKKPVIISTDPGIDDAVAIAIALYADALDVQLIVPLAGNVGIEYTEVNTRKLLTFLEKPVRVVRGSVKPLLRATQSAGNVHGLTGMEGYDFPEPTVVSETDTLAATAMHEVVQANREKTTLIGIGPLTDIALYLTQYPDDLAKIEQVVLMGGALGRGNLGVLSEFNFGTDPEAAQIVVNSGLDIVIAPMEVGRQAKVMPETSNEIKTMGKVGDMFYALFSKYRGGSFNTGLNMYDALAMGLVLAPEIFEIETTHLAIETQGSLTAGASLFDLRGYLHREPNVRVATAVNTEKFKEWLVAAIQRTAE